jgi:hypothetical protein
MFTRALEPLKLSALPYLPAAVQVAPDTIPVLPFPDESATVDPEPSPNEYAATRLDGAADDRDAGIRAAIATADSTRRRPLSAGPGPCVEALLISPVSLPR